MWAVPSLACIGIRVNVSYASFVQGLGFMGSTGLLLEGVRLSFRAGE